MLMSHVKARARQVLAWGLESSKGGLIRAAFLAAVTAIFFFPLTVRGADSPSRPPNIILILAYDLGHHDISIDGNSLIQTPNIDAIGREGVNFTRAYCTNAICSPSRAAILSGRYQQRFGFEHNADPDSFIRLLGSPIPGSTFPPVLAHEIAADKRIALEDKGMPGSEITLAELLKPRGYATGHVGKWHVGLAPAMQPQAQGFDHTIGFLNGASFYGPKDDPSIIKFELPWSNVDIALWKTLTNRLQRDGQPIEWPDTQPGAAVPHPAGETPALPGNSQPRAAVPQKQYLTDFFADEGVKFIEENKNKPFFLYLAFNAPHTPLQAPKKIYDRLSHIKDERTRIYYAMVLSLDEAVGRVMNKVKELRLDNETLVVFTSDNGGASYVRIPSLNRPFRGWKATDYEGGVCIPLMMRYPGRIKPGTVIDAPVSLLDIYPTGGAVAGAQLPTDRKIDGVDLMPTILGTAKSPPHPVLFWHNEDYMTVRAGDFKLMICGKCGAGKTWLLNEAEDIEERNNLADKMPDKVEELKALLDKFSAELPGPAWPSIAHVPVFAELEEDNPPPDAEYFYFPL